VTAGSMSDPKALDILHFPPKLNTVVAGLLSALEGRSGPVTSGEREQLARLRKRVFAFHAAAQHAVGTTLSGSTRW